MSRDFVIPKHQIAEYCRNHHIRKLSLFGSVLRDDFQEDSDIDVLVEFEPGHIPDFFSLYDMQEELSEILEGREVDLVTAGFLNHRIRDRVMAEAQVQYEQ